MKYVVTREPTMCGLTRMVVYSSWNVWSCWKFIRQLSNRGPGGALNVHLVWPWTSWRGCTFTAKVMGE